MPGVIKSDQIMGIDIGVNSIGWVLLDKPRHSMNVSPKLVANGCRIFEAGLDELERDGKGKSRNAARREARSSRRLLDRRSRRMKNLANALRIGGLLPEGDMFDHVKRHACIEELDKTLDNPYKLRARALDEKLSPYELGRALYHLGQRRGFLSNRKSAPKKKEDDGKITEGIKSLAENIRTSGKRTLGEYFASLDPRQTRIRDTYTSRAMYEDEFRKIWESQATLYPDILTEKLRKRIYGAIFYQRPLKSMARFIGRCQLEKTRRRAPWAALEAQRFRYLQKINDLRIEDENTLKQIELTSEQRSLLIEDLESKQEISFAGIRKLLKLPKTTKFNLEAGGESIIPGNKTAARLIKALGQEYWKGLSEQQRGDYVQELIAVDNEDIVKKHGCDILHLDEETATQYARVRLESGYCNFSRKAIYKLLPDLQKGILLQTAIKKHYPERSEKGLKQLDLLPPLDKSELSQLRNPIVLRSLTELRRVVNAVIAKYGKPDQIRIELARDLKKTPKQRNDAVKINRANEELRKEAARQILAEAGIENPSPSDILKYLLMVECGNECPYTGKKITITGLVGDHPQFDIEHIIPFDRCLDNSYLNKTLCYVEENRNVKRNRTPYEAYHGTEKWDDIIGRVKKFKGNAGRLKLERFCMTPPEVEKIIGDFTARQLNDTRWASKLAKKYLGLLYGGVDADGINLGGKRCVQAVSGGTTAFLRNEWDLNKILGDGPGKSRDDHRHHAVDAVVVALTDPGVVKMLSDASKRAALAKRRLFEQVPPPWEGFLDDVRNAVNNTVASHRMSRRVRGALHKETVYGKLRTDEKGKKYVHSRKNLDSLSRKNINNEDIPDPKIRQLIKEKLDQLGETDPKKAFKDIANHPVIKTKNGQTIPIHKVRIKDTLETYIEIDETRRYQSGSIHHIAYFQIEETDKWDAEVVSMYKAYERLRNHEPVVNRNPQPGWKFLFTLSGHDVIELDKDDGSRGLFVVRTTPESKQIYFVPINDARKLGDIGKTGLTALPNSLRERHCKKMIVTPLGEVRRAND